jgi:UDP-perosamine 4-acetyltransferase
LIDLIKTASQYKIAGILDSLLKVGTLVSGISVLGNDSLLPQLYDTGIKNACIAVGSVKNNSKRKMLYEKAKQLGFFLPVLLHPKAIKSEKSNIAEGVQIMAGAIIQTNTFIDENTIINTGTVLEHDCLVGKHVHISPGAIISGGCKIYDGAFIGTGATIIQGCKIGSDSIVAAGSVVINDVLNGKTVMGIPAK